MAKPGVVTGTPGDDVILGTAGDDRIDAGAGSDTICGGDGDDKLDGGTGVDEIYGGAGDDRVKGEKGDDLLSAGEGQDKLIGAQGEDLLRGQEGVDTADGGDGSDVCDAETEDGCEAAPQTRLVTGMTFPVPNSSPSGVPMTNPAEEQGLLEAELHIRRGEGRPVVPEHIVPQLEGVRGAPVGDVAVRDRRHARGQLRDRPAARIQGDQAVVHRLPVGV